MVGSRNLLKAKKTANLFKCNNFGNYEDVIKNTNVDIIYISVPNTKRENIFKLAVKNKKHVFCENPAFINTKQALKYIKLFKKNKLMFFECLMYKHHRQHEIVQKVIDNNQIGKMKIFNSQFTYPYPNSGNIRLKSSLKGGVFFDSIIYPLSAALLFINSKPKSIYCTFGYDKKNKVDNFVQIQIKFNNNVFTNIVAGFGIYYKSFYQILFDKGEIVAERAFSVNENFSPIIKIEKNDKIKKIKVPADNQFKNMIDNYCNMILKEKTNYNKYVNQILYFYKIFDLAYKSSKKNKAEHYK